MTDPIQINARAMRRMHGQLVTEVGFQQRANFRKKRKLLAIRSENKRLKRIMRRALPWSHEFPSGLREEFGYACLRSSLPDQPLISQMNNPHIDLKNGEKAVVVSPSGQVQTFNTVAEAQAHADQQKKKLQESGQSGTPEVKQTLLG